MDKAMSTVITSATYYTARAKAVRTLADSVLGREVGDEIVVTAGHWYGYGEKHPAWSENVLEKFGNLADVQEYVEELSPKVHGFDVIPDTVEVLKVDTVTHTTQEVVQIDG
jgi:hypothetical protein